MESKSSPLVGLTGGIGTGKSVVAAVLRSLGVPVVDADTVAREVVAPGTPGLSELVAEFGGRILTPDATLDRQALARIAFRDDAARARLNAIVHPRIAGQSRERIAEARATGAPYVVYDAALIIENGLTHGFDAVVLLVATQDRQLRRIMHRDGIGADDAAARIAAQWTNDRKRPFATHVIENDGDLPTLQERSRALHRTLIERFSR